MENKSLIDILPTGRMFDASIPNEDKENYLKDLQNSSAVFIYRDDEENFNYSPAVPRSDDGLFPFFYKDCIFVRGTVSKFNNEYLELNNRNDRINLDSIVNIAPVKLYLPVERKDFNIFFFQSLSWNPQGKELYMFAEKNPIRAYLQYGVMRKADADHDWPALRFTKAIKEEDYVKTREFIYYHGNEFGK